MADVFLRSLVLGEFGSATETNGDGDTTGYRLWTRDGSWAHVEGSTVRQAGPHRLWDTVEKAHSWFESHDRPSRERFGATVARDGQHYWLDEPHLRIPGLT